MRREHSRVVRGTALSSERHIAAPVVSFRALVPLDARQLDLPRLLAKLSS